MEIVIVRNWRRLYVYINEKIDREYPVAVGAPSMKTPLGVFKIINKALNPGGAYGTRWMGLSLVGYGIHGTNDPTSIGKSISHGCVRMYNPDVEQLYEMIPVGTIVRIVVTPEEIPLGYQEPSGKPYEVKQGDTIYTLAKQFNTTVDNIVSTNHLKNTEGHIYPGQILIIK